MKRNHDQMTKDTNIAPPSVSIPESDLRSHNHQHSAMSYFPGDSENYSYKPASHVNSSRQEHKQNVLHSQYGCHSGYYPESSFEDLLSHTNSLDYSSYHDNEESLHDSPMDPMLTETEIAALSNFQPCNDCTPATKTTIPHHHHHPSGRLAGAAAQLDGHFCCSWLVHGQPCFLCFESAEALDHHIKNDHAGKDGTYRCLWQSCSKQDNSTQTAGPMNFGNKPKLMRHVHSHTGYKPFPCSYPGCDKGFVTKEQLKNHETTHTKSRQYKCELCGKAFAVKSALTTHITAVHESKKIHTCDICGKGFADSSNLSKHKQTHFRDSRVRKQRSRRGTASNQSTPSISTPVAEPATPVMQFAGIQDYSTAPFTSGLMAPPAAPKHPASQSCSNIPTTYSTFSTTSTASSPPPEAFDPNCYCCDQRCPPPDGPPTPCNETDDCDKDGFCDLPDCAPVPCNSPEDCDQDSFCDLPDCFELETSASTYHCTEPHGHHQMAQLHSHQLSQQWDDYVGESSIEQQRPISQYELEEQFTNMHGN